MPKVTFLQPDGTLNIVNAEPDWSLMQIAVENKVPGIEGACGGSMACATCHVYIHPEWVQKVIGQFNEQCDEERDILDTAFDIRETSRLGCQIRVTEALDGLVVALPGTRTNWNST